MPAPTNPFKTALAADRTLFGLWLALTSPYSAELCAGAGFDWLLIDAEHAPNDIAGIAAQLQVLAARAPHPVVRLPVGETWLIKKALDIGVQSLLIPMVDTPEQAAELVRACRYPPRGVRGMGAGLGRASDFGRIADYAATADDGICLIVQVESRKAVGNLEAIVATEGVDAVLIGPADLSADLGFGGDAGAPEVIAVVEDVVRRVRAAGKPVGIMTPNEVLARRALAAGAGFIAMGSDVGLLSSAAGRHLAEMRALGGDPRPAGTGVTGGGY